MSAQTLPFVKMACSLDTNPKIRKAGREAREIYLFMLRRNGELGLSGTIPAHYMSPEYLADMLMMDVSQVEMGLSRLVHARLGHQDNGVWTIIGWEESWGKKPRSEAERKREYRERKRLSHDVRDTNGTETDVRDCPDIRGDKNRIEDVAPSAPAIQQELAELLRSEIVAKQPTHALAAKKAPASWAKTIGHMLKADSRSEQRIRAVVNWLFHVQPPGKFETIVESADSLRKKFDAIERRMGNVAPTKSKQPEPENYSTVEHDVSGHYAEAAGDA